MNLDIHSGITTSIILLAIATIAVFLSGLRTLQSVNKIQFFRIRRETTGQGWLVIFISFLMLIFTILLGTYAEPIIYNYLPPTATIPLTSTPTLSPTISITPTITTTPTITNTPSVTSTPGIPPTIEAGFLAQLAPNPDAVFSPLRFSRRIDNTNQPISPLVEFKNPVGHLYGTYSFDKMTDGSQWTALWYRNGELVYFETTVWEGGSGGYGYTDWNPSEELWQPGEYEVQLFAGNQWKRSGTFTIIGFPSTATPTSQPSATVAITLKPTLKVTSVPTP